LSPVGIEVVILTLSVVEGEEPLYFVSVVALAFLYTIPKTALNPHEAPISSSF
jgi:hypothetical protein